MNHGNELPKVIDKSQTDIEAAITAIQTCNLPSSTKEFVISCIRLAIWLPKAVVEHKIKLSNLRKLIFGVGKKNKEDTEAKEDKKETKESSIERVPSAQEPLPDDSHLSTTVEKNSIDAETPAANHPTIKGHGRLSHTAYINTIEHQLLIADLKAGDPCPLLCGGKLYFFDPGIIVRIKGQNLAVVHKYWVNKLRCASCSYLIKAEIPEAIGNEKYDETFKAILVLQKYYVAVPFYRQAYFQSLLGVPLPASTQWQLIEEVGSAALLVFPTLERMAANGDVVHNDDSHVKIIDIIRDNRLHPNKERTGMFTTGFVSRTDQRDIALFYNGTQHAGENMERLLKKRDAHADTVIQMCDALSRNAPASFKTILCNCLSHGFRKFNDLKDFYPDPCIVVIELIAKVYQYDEETKELTQQERLYYHQKNSAPIMAELHQYITQQLESKSVEPNDSLGKAIRYMLKHWHPLTQFLRVPGAPLDNNIVERALKIPIRGRRTWLFYKTEYGAMIGGVLTSIIYTCALSDISPLHYLVSLQENKDRIIKEPENWLPWNYHDALSVKLLAA